LNRPVHDSTAASRRAAGNIALALGLAVVLSLAFALGVAAVARADVPSVRFCTADSTLVLSPGGGFAYTVHLRDDTNVPVPGATVVLDFTNAIGVTLCSDQDPDNDRRVFGTTNAAGVATFWIKGGGATTGTVTVGSAFDVITHAHVVTTDFDGNMTVDASDRAALAALVGSAGPAGDLDRNGTVNANDQAMFEAHFGNTCAETAAVVMTWGRLKSMFR